MCISEFLETTVSNLNGRLAEPWRSSLGVTISALRNTEYVIIVGDICYYIFFPKKFFSSLV